MLLEVPEANQFISLECRLPELVVQDVKRESSSVGGGVQCVSVVRCAIGAGVRVQVDAGAEVSKK